jgi:hypothetical protein
MTKFTQPWGFSKLDVFRTCKAKFKYQFIDKLPQRSSAALERGGEIHENIEAYLNGWTQELSPDVESWREALDLIKQRNFKGEQAIGITRDWRTLPDWFHPDTWLRVKMDTYYRDGDTLHVIDYKSGKYRIPSTDQVELYAVAGLSIYPDIKEVEAEYWFIDTGDFYKKTYTAMELKALRKKYEKESDALYVEAQWEPQPSSECRWCPYSKTKGGPCRY